MKTRNLVQLIGYVGNDPHLKTSADQADSVLLRVATDHYIEHAMDKAPRKITTWHEVVAYDKLAKLIMENTCKGSHVLIEGRIEYTKPTDAHGNARYYTQIIAEHFVDLDR